MVDGNRPPPLPPPCLAAVASANAGAYGSERGIHRPSATVTSEQTITTYETTVYTGILGWVFEAKIYSYF